MVNQHFADFVVRSVMSHILTKSEINPGMSAQKLCLRSWNPRSKGIMPDAQPAVPQLYGL